MGRLSFIVVFSMIIAACGETPPAQSGQVNPEAVEKATQKGDCEQLMNAVLPFAEEMLTNHGEFQPFGGTMTPDGQIGMTGGWTGDEHPASTEVIELVKAGFRAGAERGEYKATALVFDVR